MNMKPLNGSWKEQTAHEAQINRERDDTTGERIVTTAYAHEKKVFDDIIARKTAATLKNVEMALIRTAHELDPTCRLPLMGDEFWKGLARAAVTAAATELSPSVAESLLCK